MILQETTGSDGSSANPRTRADASKLAKFPINTVALARCQARVEW